VVNVPWEDAVAFCTWLSRRIEEPFHLPTEAEWEKAARLSGLGPEALPDEFLSKLSAW
jgi:formylglycine-generating enzyme required for sulfatase activity